MKPLEEIAPLADIPVELEMELDRKVLPFREIAAWEPGSVLWLTRSAGENIGIYCGGVHVGFGEAVVIENTFGVRITDFRAER